MPSRLLRPKIEHAGRHPLPPLPARRQRAGDDACDRRPKQHMGGMTPAIVASELELALGPSYFSIPLSSSRSGKVRFTEVASQQSISNCKRQEVSCLSAAKVVDFSLASAKVESARGFIGISASIPNFLELFIKLRAAIQRAYETRRERECGLVKWLAESEWQDEPVQSVADKVPQGGGSDQRQEQEWPRFNTVVAHAVGKAICSSGKGKGVPFRDIDQTCATDRCVDGKTPERFCALSGFELHEEVKENNWLSEVIEKVAEANAYRFGDPVLIRECYRADERLVDGLRDLKGLNC